MANVEKKFVVKCLPFCLLLTAIPIHCANSASSANAPSFSCNQANAPDELAICANARLSQLDVLVSKGFRYIKAHYGAARAKSIGAPLLRSRRKCGSDTNCIKERQIEALNSFKLLGAFEELPAWTAGIVELSYAQIKDNFNVGDCVVTKISEIAYRLCSIDNPTDCLPESGSSVSLSNGMYGVSYEIVPEIHQSIVGDVVVACLISIPQDCPIGDDRGYVWKMENRRTHKSWELADASHMCGGA